MIPLLTLPWFNIFTCLIFFLVSGYFLLDHQKYNILCWIINEYFGQYFKKTLVLGNDLQIESSMSNGEAKFLGLDLNCQTLNNILSESKSKFRFEAFSFDRFTFQTNFTDVTMNLENPAVSISLNSPQYTSPEKTSPGVFAYFLTAFVLLTVAFFLSPILMSFGFGTTVATLATWIGYVGAVGGAILYTPKLQRTVVYFALHCLGKNYLHYLEGKSLSLEQLEVDILSGCAKLTDIVLDRDVLNGLANERDVRIKVVNVRAKSISVKVPWQSLTLNNSRVTLTEVSIEVQPTYRRDLGSEGYTKIMLNVCSAFLNLVKTVYPTNAVNAMQLQLRQIAVKGHVFVEPKVDFKMNQGTITLVAETTSKEIKLPALSTPTSNYYTSTHDRSQPRRPVFQNVLSNFVSAITNILPEPNQMVENRQVVYN